jgi:hypothetical protein
MRRLQLFEFGDQPWLPPTLRDAMTAYLAAVYKVTPFPSLWTDRLAPLLSANASNEIVDLGSGAAGPVPLVMAELSRRGFKAHVTLTDLYPNTHQLGVAGSAITYWPLPVDATNVPAELPGILTIFSIFHHFRPAMAHQILKNAFGQRRPICIFEASSRAVATILSSVLIPLVVLILTPFIRPVSISQLVFTYLIPILPLLIFWDGLVSHLRTYSVDELARMTNDLRSTEYVWEVGSIRVPGMPATVPYLIGRLAG